MVDAAWIWSFLFLGICLLACGSPETATHAMVQDSASISVIRLPVPTSNGTFTLEQALKQRRSIRSFSAKSLTMAEIGQLLWAAQGITASPNSRTAPSAGALNPLEIYTVTSKEFGHYDPKKHELRVEVRSDLRPRLYKAAFEQDTIRDAPLVIVISAVYQRTIRKYGNERGPRYVHMEAGHAAQNILLQAVAMHLGAVPVGAFQDEKVKAALDLPADHEPLYLIPVGHPD